MCVEVIKNNNQDARRFGIRNVLGFVILYGVLKPIEYSISTGFLVIVSAMDNTDLYSMSSNSSMWDLSTSDTVHSIELDPSIEKVSLCQSICNKIRQTLICSVKLC